MKYKIEYVKKPIMPGGYIGMNKRAANSTEHYSHLKIPFKQNENVIRVLHSLPSHIRKHTIRHEETELYFMKNKGMDYHKAHALALKFEKKEMPFPKKDIERKLKQIGLIK